MMEGSIDAHDDSSEEDSRPLRIKRRVAPLPEKFHENELGGPMWRLRRCVVSSSKRSHASSCKMQGSDAVFSKKSHGNVKEEQDGQPQPKMQHNDVFLAEKLSGTGPYTFVPDNDIIYEDEDREASPPIDDEELLDNLGFGGFPVNLDRPHIHQIFVHTDPCEKSGCVKLLEAIKCGDRFIACSIETSVMFYAKLAHKEAAKLRGVDGVWSVMSLRDLVGTY